MRSAKTWSVAAILVAGFTHSVTARAATLHVPTEHPTIQSCIDAAVSGQDECVVAPGTYNELINFLGKAITLRSSDGPEVTTIDGTGLNGSVVTFDNGESPESVLDGFTITGGVGGRDMYGYVHGAGLDIQHSSPTIIHNIVTGNVSDRDFAGGIYLGGSTAILAGNIIERNKADDGAGIYVASSSPVITNNMIRENIAQIFGGGLKIRYSSLILANNVIIGNQAIIGAGVFLELSSPYMKNNLFVGNSARAIGGGMFLAGSAPSIANCVIVSNSAGSDGGALFLNESFPTVMNTIVASNSTGIYQYAVSTIVATFQFCDVQGNTRYNFSGLPSQIGTDGNISEEPLFVRNPSAGGDGWGDIPSTPDIDEGANDDYGDLRLQPGSPCINAGDPNFVSSQGETDLDGHALVLCGGVDMGAYEFGIGDYDCNQAVDLADLSVWEECQTGPIDPPLSPTASAALRLIKGGGSGCEAFDFDGDGDVDLSDYGRLQVILAP